MEAKLQEIAKKLLSSSEADLIIGYGQTSDGIVEPVFIRTADDCNKLKWNNQCFNNLAVYLTKDFIKKAGKVAVVVKGCDAKAVVGLIQESQIKKENIIVIGMACEGVGDPVLEKCSFCDVKTPKFYDHLIGAEIKSNPVEGKFSAVEKFEKLSIEEKKKFWEEQYSKCIKCYACRAACPLCYCQQCIVEKNQPQWIPTSPHQKGNFLWNFIRAFHLAGRCVGCNECERVCPVGIPLSLLNNKISSEIKESFNYEAGYDTEKEPPLTCFEKNDNEDFIL